MSGKISLIMLTKNNQQTIEITVDSILNQDYQNFELIIVSDPSTDGTIELIKENYYQNKKIKHFSSETAIGTGASLELGLRKATGEYLYLIDADDFIHVNTLQLLINKIEGYPFVGGLLTFVNPSTFNKNLVDSQITYPDNHEGKFEELNKTNQTMNYNPLGILFKADFIKGISQPINKNLNYFYCGKIIHEMLLHGKQPVVYDAIYYKRSRRKVITAPSLSQASPVQTRADFYEMLTDLINQADSNSRVVKIYATEIKTYYIKKVVPLSELEIVAEKQEFERLMKVLSALLKKDVALDLTKDFTYYQRKEVDAIKKRSLTKYLKYKKRNNTLKIIKSLKYNYKNKRSIFNFNIYQLFFKKLPRKRGLVLYESFYGKDLSDSPKFIYEYMEQTYPNKFKNVWSFDHASKLNKASHSVVRGSLKYYYLVARASFWVNNTRMPVSMEKNKGTKFLQTWHGTPLKRLFLDMTGQVEAFEGTVVRQAARWDYLVSANEFSTKHLSSAFGYSGKVLELGYPRNDKLYTGDNIENINKLKSELGLPLDKKVLLYAPTWRDDKLIGSSTKCEFELTLDIEALRAQLSDDYVLVLRLHYHVKQSSKDYTSDDFIFNFSTYPDIADLYLVSDVLITDYSSVFFDYAHLKRPMLFFMYDADHYFSNLRGSYIDDLPAVLPGPLVKENDQLITSIKELDFYWDQYGGKYTKFHDEFCAYGRGESAKGIAEKFFLDHDIKS